MKPRNLFFAAALAAFAAPATPAAPAPKALQAPKATPADTGLYSLQVWPPETPAGGDPTLWTSTTPADSEDLLAAYSQVRSASFAGWAPAGIYALTRIGAYPQLHQVAAPGADRRQKTFFKRRVDQWYANPVPAKALALVALDQGGDEDFSLRLLDLRTGRTAPTACPPGRVTAVVWNDSGTAFLYAHTPAGTDRWDIRMGRLGRLGAGDPPLGTRDSLLLSLPGTWIPMDWAPDGTRAVVQRYTSSTESELHLLSLGGGATSGSEVTRLLPGDPPQQFDHACWVRLPETGSNLPETGKTLGLAFTSDRDGAFQRLFLLRDGESKPMALSPPSLFDVEWVATGGDRRTLIYSLNEQGMSALHAVKPGISPLAPPAAARLPGLPKGIIDGALFHPSGREFGFTVNAAAFPGEAFTYRLDTRKARRWTESETAGLPQDAFREPELILYPTFDSVGTGKDRAARRIPAWLYAPPPGTAPAATTPAGSNRRATTHPAVATDHGTPRPVLIQIHGGPEQQARGGFDPLVQYLAGQMGVAVILPNVRGSSGYGKDWLKADDGFLRTGAVADIGALLDWVATRPDLDPTRVAVAGRSYGGFMALASLTRYGERIKGGVSTVGITHFPTFLQETSGYRRDLRRAEYGDERDPRMAAFLDSLSPLRHLDRLKQPLMLAHGRNDPRVPYAESVRLFEALKARKVPVRLLTFNQEGHAFRSEASQAHYNRALADFLAGLFDLPPPP